MENTRDHSDTSPREDTVLDDIEKFMYECENMSKLAVNPQNRRVYNSETELLKILISQDRDKNIKTKGTNSSKEKVTMDPVPPKKRKLNVPVKEIKKNVTKAGKSPLKKKVQSNTGQVKARKLHRAEMKEITEPKFTTCKKLISPKKRKSKGSTFWPQMHEAVTSFVGSEVDAKLLEKVKVENNIVDLTYDDDVYCMYLKFANISDIEFAESLDITPAVAVATVEADCRCNVSTFTPKIKYHVQGACVDVSDIEDVPLSSEKECANQILESVYQFHKLTHISQKIEQALQEIEDCVGPTTELIKDQEVVLSVILKHTQSLCAKFGQALSRIHVRNLNLLRFLDILSSKLYLKYNVSVAPDVICFYLDSLLKHSSTFCTNQLSQQIALQVERQKIKQETEIEPSKEALTAEQLQELCWQIEKYHEIAIRQEELMTDNKGLEQLGLPLLSKTVKKEMLNLCEGPLFQNRSSVICILDD